MSRHSRRLANKAHRAHIRQARQQKRDAAAEVRQTATDYASRLIGQLFPRLLRQPEYNPAAGRRAADGGRAAVAG